MKLLLSLSLLAVPALAVAQDDTEESQPPYWMIQEQLPHDAVTRFSRGSVLTRGDRVVGIENAIPARISVIPKVPEMSAVQRVYYGYEEAALAPHFEIQDDELTLLYHIIEDFSYRETAERTVYAVSENGEIQPTELETYSLTLHQCTLGIYFVLGDGSFVVIDGHPDSAVFVRKPKPGEGFRNDVLNAFLSFKMKGKDNANQRIDPTSVHAPRDPGGVSED